MEEKTASIIIVGNEILTGKVQDRNISFIASRLCILGIELKEVRIVKDIEADIIEAVNFLRKKYSYLFTTGGIGPTHDDITVISIAKAFNVPLEKSDIAYEMISSYYSQRKEQMNEAREKMAFIPKGANLIDNDISKAPGFVFDNVFVMAGVPEIMKSMFGYVEKYLHISSPIIMKTIKIYEVESKIAEIMSAIQKKYVAIEIGSYPFIETEATEIVFKGKNTNEIDGAIEEISIIFDNKNFEYEIE